MKKMFHVVFIVIVLVGMTNVSAQVAAAKHSGVRIGPFRDGDSMLQCKYIGKMTIEQTYEKDSRVVHMQNDKNVATYMILVIEEQ